jgi:hypothetical protein
MATWCEREPGRPIPTCLGLAVDGAVLESNPQVIPEKLNAKVVVFEHTRKSSHCTFSVISNEKEI